MGFSPFKFVEVLGAEDLRKINFSWQSQVSQFRPAVRMVFSRFPISREEVELQGDVLAESMSVATVHQL
jgi:hypothetical protein